MLKEYRPPTRRERKRKRSPPPPTRREVPRRRPNSEAYRGRTPRDAKDLHPFARTKKNRPSTVADEVGEEDDGATRHTEDEPGSTVFPSAVEEAAQVEQ